MKDRQALIYRIKLLAQTYGAIRAMANALSIPTSETRRAYSYQTLFEGLAEFLERIRDNPDFENRVKRLIEMMDGQESWEFVDSYSKEIGDELLDLTDP